MRSCRKIEEMTLLTHYLIFVSLKKIKIKKVSSLLKFEINHAGTFRWVHSKLRRIRSNFGKVPSIFGGVH